MSSAKHTSHPGRRKLARPGFTLVELLFVCLILGILIGLAVRRYERTRQRAYVATLQSELRQLATQQELYHHAHGIYAELASLLDYTSSPSVDVEFTYADVRGWAAVATHEALNDFQCGMFTGDLELAAHAQPATEPGRIACGPGDGGGDDREED